MPSYILRVCFCLFSFLEAFENDHRDNLFQSAKLKDLVVDSSLNIQWVKSIEFWNFPLLSNNELFAAVKMSTAPEEFANITISQLQNTCFFCTGTNIDEGSVHTYGLRRKLFETKYSLRPKKKGIIDWFKGDLDQFKDGSRGFILASVPDAVPIKEMNKIYKKLETLGFQPRNSFAVKSECKNDDFVKKVKGSLQNLSDLSFSNVVF